MLPGATLGSLLTCRSPARHTELFSGELELIFNNVIAAIPEFTDGSAGLGDYRAGA